MDFDTNVRNYVIHHELAELASDRVQLIYRDFFSPILNRLPSSTQVVVHYCHNESIPYWEIENLLSTLQNYFVIVLTKMKYPELAKSSPRHRIISIPSSYGLFSKFYKLKPKTPTQKNHFNKLFFSLNNRGTWDRHALAQFVLNFNLLDRMYFSYRCTDRFKVGQRKLFDNLNQTIGTDRTWFNQNIDFEDFFDRLPIVSDFERDTEVDFSPVAYETVFGMPNETQLDYYDQSFCSIINETYHVSNCDPFFTEKTFKPIGYGHPFLMFGCVGSLQTLRELGFETFDDVFDESYDLIENNQQRLEAVFKEMLRISELSQDQLRDMHNKIVPKLKHNQNVFWNVLPATYENEIKIAKQEIVQIINSL